jgi:hypothetical protein
MFPTPVDDALLAEILHAVDDVLGVDEKLLRVPVTQHLYIYNIYMQIWG